MWKSNTRPFQWYKNNNFLTVWIFYDILNNNNSDFEKSQKSGSK